jgi:hypothetical protein
MTAKSAVVWSCAHAKPEAPNDRFNWLGDFIEDIKPDYCIDLGDSIDLSSLNSYDTRYPKAIVSQSYEADINSFNESQSILWDRYKVTKRKRPHRIGFAGNHCHRLNKAIAIDPRLEGSKYGISVSHMQTDHWFDDYYPYENSGPAIADYDGVSYSHFFSAGNFGTAISGMHHAYALLQHRHSSAVCGHSHKRGIYFKDGAHPNPIIGMVVGCFKGKEEAWAGQAQNDWWHGVTVLRNIDKGWFDPEFISMERLKQAYG